MHDVGLCTMCWFGAVLLAPARRRRHRAPGGGRVAGLITGLDAGRVRENLARVREELPDGVRGARGRQVRPARGAGDARRGRHRRSSARTAPRTWRRRPTPTPAVPLALHRPAPEPQGQGDPPARRADPLRRVGLRARQLEHHGTPETEILVEVNVAGEEGKAGIAPERARRVHRALPGARGRPDDDAAVHRGSRGQPARLRRAARARRRARPAQLSMGTSQDYRVAAEEGATIVRLGTSLYA